MFNSNLAFARLVGVVRCCKVLWLYACLSLPHLVSYLIFTCFTDPPVVFFFLCPPFSQTYYNYIRR
ncbi:hypothetical protein F4805DRAFT_438880 [Annulohypoxylon moriforme]|nr:hypothetical protein F4805DRAFT_438880 [Annulohypoxylon moriforme]